MHAVPTETSELENASWLRALVAHAHRVEDWRLRAVAEERYLLGELSQVHARGLSVRARLQHVPMSTRWLKEHRARATRVAHALLRDGAEGGRVERRARARQHGELDA